MDLTNYIATNRETEIRILCPFCEQKLGSPDSKYHCYVNQSKGIYNCYRCGSGGKLDPSKNNVPCGTSLTLQDIKNKIKGTGQVVKSTAVNLDEISMPLSETETPQAWKYLREERKFTLAQLKKYKLCVGKTKMWSGRVIFPFTEGGRIVFAVGRTYMNRDPKYLNSKGAKSSVLYGIDNVVGNTCFLCEGIISSIAAEKHTKIPAVALLGKTISDSQVAKLRNKCSHILVCLDGTADVTKSQINSLTSRLLKSGLRVSVVSLPADKDPDECTQDEFLKAIHNAKKHFV